MNFYTSHEIHMLTDERLLNDIAYYSGHEYEGIREQILTRLAIKYKLMDWHADPAQKNSIESAQNNEVKLLKIIAQQKWVREDEAALLTGLSKVMVSRTAVRLAKAEEIYRDKKPAGFFLRLKKAGSDRVASNSGKRVKIPNSWRHHCLSIQSLDYLFTKLSCDSYSTEAQIRARLGVSSGARGKIADGVLVKTNKKVFLETEWSNKGGDALHMQARTLATLAKYGDECIVCYPCRPNNFKGEFINHERNNTKAIRQAWGDAPAPNIRFLRCLFDDNVAYLHARPSAFELIDLPERQQSKPEALIDEVAGYQWKDDNGMSHLWLNGQIVRGDVEFREATEDMPAICLFEDDQIDDGMDDEFSQFEVKVKNAFILAHRENISVHKVIRKKFKSRQ